MADGITTQTLDESAIYYITTIYAFVATHRDHKKIPRTLELVHLQCACPYLCPHLLRIANIFPLAVLNYGEYQRFGNFVFKIVF